MREVPTQDRPRERLLDRGAEVLSDRELLALLPGAGLAGQARRRTGGSVDRPARRAVCALARPCS
ncbi:UPF0758 domain-containing protein [Streptomyces tauricus]|uniref:UPF0758 domain-containing protein n=1 Tax=Streptomyces tauricus TaxID=68274 RepID=UPI0033A4FA92